MNMEMVFGNQKLTQNRLVYDELSPNLEPKVNDVQLS
jgi:hypothetical protein